VRLIAPIECRRASPSGTSSLTLVGRSVDGEWVHLTLQAVVPAGLPARIDVGSVERLADEHYRIVCSDREWLIDASRSFAHYDVSAPFYAALPPRRVPLAKRVFWRLVLAAAASRPGRRWLMRDPR
jgi:hypothetical protein